MLEEHPSPRTGVHRVPAQRTLLADRLASARLQYFVGREPELALFADALRDVPGAPTVIVVYGPGGIGKSALLQRFAAQARTVGRPVVSVDARLIEPSPAAFREAAGQALAADHAVLLVDSFERCRELEPWLRDQFLPGLPAGVLVVVASRLAPDPLWTADLGWSEVLQVVPLGELDSAQSVALLASQGADTARHGALLSFAAGNPLALRLAAEVAVQDGSDNVVWAPSRAVVEQLLSHLVGELPSPAHRRALEVCGHVVDTTEELLRVVLPDEDVGALFSWLRQLPCVRSGRYGVYPNDVVRDALDSDFRWRDPEQYKTMHRAVRRHLVERARNAPEKEALQATAAYQHVISRAPWHRPFQGGWQEGGAYEEPLGHQDPAILVEMARATEGEESARAVAYWLDEQPQAFHLHRRYSTGELLGFMAWLRVEDLDERARAEDPLVADVWETFRQLAPVRHGEHLGIARFMIHPASYHRPSRAWDLVHVRIPYELLRADHCAWSCVILADADFWEPLMTYLDMTRLPGEAGRHAGGRVLFGHDWRAARVDDWTEGIDARLLSGPPRRPTGEPRAREAALTRAELDAAVRDALRCWLDPDGLAASPLLRLRLVQAQDGVDPVTALRELISKAVQRLERNPRTRHLHAVLTMTFQSSSTQEAVARRLNLAFSTYRRHLGRGIDDVRERLWQWETQGHIPN
ncbi:ATP-binding protein [Streptomyces sp. NPDC057702]|uniref:ATP-binding protein n=1 Tax=unclassified Streptomyces TaxID=2593676 RepID=UPI0036C49975